MYLIFFQRPQLEGDLLAEEFNDVWDKAPKFPDVETSDERLDVDSFVQVYRDIDDLFESGDDTDDTSVSTPVAAKTSDAPQPVAATASAAASQVTTSAQDTVISEAVSDANKDSEEHESLEAELESIYESLCDQNGLISKDSLGAWDEVSKLLVEGLLGRDEFEDLWVKTKKSPGSSEELDVDGFLSFNVALDGLFEFGDDEMTEDDDEEPLPFVASPAVAETLEIVEGESLSVLALYTALADSDGLVGKNDLKRWGELQDMLADGEMLPLELEDLFERVSKSAQDATKLDEIGFTAMFKAIEDLFEADDDDQAEQPTLEPEAELSGSSEGELKQELLDILDEVNSDTDRLACGLESDERQQRQILSIVADLENGATNIIRQKKGAIAETDLTGTWDLLYSSSSAMKFNKGLSGIGGSFPNGKFGGLKQKLLSSKFMTDVEYIERIEVTPSTASFDVTVTGGWDLRTSVSIFTGEPSLVMTVEPDKVTYGPTSTKADHWKSLGPMNMLDVSFLDESLRIMRGNTSIETVFIFQRCP